MEAYTHQAVEFIKGGIFSLGESQLLQLYNTRESNVVPQYWELGDIMEKLDNLSVLP